MEAWARLGAMRPGIGAEFDFMFISLLAHCVRLWWEETNQRKGTPVKVFNQLKVFQLNCIDQTAPGEVNATHLFKASLHLVP